MPVLMRICGSVLKGRGAAVSDAKPPLKWAGGKRWLVPELLGLWDDHMHRRLVEPFCGGLAVSLALKPLSAILNDINPHLINFYLSLQQGSWAEIPMRNSRTQYEANRRSFNRLIQEKKADTPKAAALFYYLNRTGFNGLCRFNQGGLFNVPFGQYKQINYMHDFSDYRDAFKNFEFINQDFESLKVEPEDFIYADPPYDVEFTQYSKVGFQWDDQVRLTKWLAKHPGPVVLSNQATERIIKLYKDHDFEVRFLNAPRRISCNGDRTPAREVIATKNL